MAEIIVKGLSELQQFLDTLAPRIEQNIMRGALRAGVKPIKAAVVSACPTAPPSETGRVRYKLYEGAMRDSIRTSVKAKNGKVTASVKVGGKLKNGADVWYAYLIEYTGAKAHIIQAKNGGALAIGGGLYKAVEHPGMDAKPFVRPALDTQAHNAIAAAAEYIKSRLATKEGLNAAADVQIEVQ